MNPKVALITCIVLIVWLLRIERKINPTASLALWIPTFLLLIMGSRPVGKWFNYSPVLSEGGEAGSPLDRWVLSILMIIALLILSKRKIEWSRIFKDNLWLILLYVYLVSSVLWSDFPLVSFKRWFRITISVVLSVVILSEKQPLQSLESVLRRCAYVLVPLSLVLIKYFPNYGVQYDRWEGTRMGTGVTTHKNSLGVLCALSSFTLIWAVLRKFQVGKLFKNRYHSFADALVIGIGLFLLFGGGGTYSATSITIFIVGITTLLVLSRMKNLAIYVSNNLKAMVIIGVGLFLLIGNLGLPTYFSFLNRNANLTGRDEIWSSILKVASQNSMFGVGYGGYWGMVKEAYSKHHEVMQSHNGYLEVYLQVGIVGIIALFAFFMEFCGKLRREFNYIFDWGVLGICFLIMVLLYNYTESGFIEAGFLWTITVFLTVFFSAPDGRNVNAADQWLAGIGSDSGRPHSKDCLTGDTPQIRQIGGK